MSDTNDCDCRQQIALFCMSAGVLGLGIGSLTGFFLRRWLEIERNATTPWQEQRAREQAREREQQQAREQQQGPQEEIEMR